MPSKQFFRKAKVAILTLMLISVTSLAVPATALAVTACGGGSGNQSYTPSIDLGCSGKGNAILDLAFGIIKFLSFGVGLVIVASMVYAGIQYIGSRGDPNANVLAVKRIQANVTALLVFVFAYAIINYLVPGALLK